MNVAVASHFLILNMIRKDKEGVEVRYIKSKTVGVSKRWKLSVTSER